ncbi:MAG: ATP-binding protein [Omnitrophica WOR_2 bacterium]
MNIRGNWTPNRRATLAYFSSTPGGSFRLEKWQMWRGIAEAAREFGANLIYIAGEEYDSLPQAHLYELIDRDNVDGLILWSSFFSPRSPIENTSAYIRRYGDLPIVSIELELEGCSQVLLDNARGISDVLDHLVKIHGYQRIAFINQQNNLTAKTRLEAFEQVLRKYGLFDSRLVMTLEELEAARLQPGIDYQAIVAHTDQAAALAIEALRRTGVRIPDDVAVTGFNDGEEARGSLPPLTTLRIPFRKIGRNAVEMLVKKIAGDGAPERTCMPLQLILRRSCGCLEPMAEQAALGPVKRLDMDLSQVLIEQRKSMIAEMSGSMGTAIDSQADSWAEKLLDIFFDELANPQNRERSRLPSQVYLRDLNQLLIQAISEGSNVSRWHEALSVIRRHINPYLHGTELEFGEDLWQQGRVLVGQAAVRAEIHHGWQASRQTGTMRDLEAELLMSFDFDELLKILIRGLSQIGIQNFYLVLYKGEFSADGQSRLMLACRDSKQVQLDQDGLIFPTRLLLPEGWLEARQPYSLVVEALHSNNEKIGFVVLESDPPVNASDCDIYQALRIQLSSAVKGVRLRQTLREALKQAEEANQLKSRFLSMVSHELRTPLNLIVGLSEMALRQKTHGSKNTVQVLSKFLEQIYISGQHLDRLIRDVLDLASSQAGQMNLICKPLDLVPILIDTAAMGEQLAEQKNLQFRSEIPERLPMVWGDKTRLRQVLLNLLSNAVKFTAHGEVTLTVSYQQNEILISVEDTGLGIAKGEQEKIFDEFYQSDRSTVRGYGGAGLGLAITRRLVEMHGGKIWASSDGMEGCGSTFCFTLPIMPERLLVYEPEPAKTRDGTVLILTKNTGSAGELMDHLSKQGFSVEIAELDDSLSVTDSLLFAPPGAVVLDLAPSSEQGWIIMKKLKENPHTQDIPVLFYSFVTGQDTGTMVEMDYLAKPIRVEELIRALKRHGLKSTGDKASYTILIIDDEPGILELHARMIQLELPESHVLTARDGKQGLELMRQEIPDLVLLDLMMPELDGFGILKAMQEEEILRNIPVIVISGQQLTQREMERLSQGAEAVLGKGLFSTREVMERIGCALSRSKRLGNEAQRLVNQTMGYIHEHYKDPISRSDIARCICVNEQYLSRVFKKQVGVGPMTYLTRYRIQQAKRLLEMNQLSVTQVALEVGFSSQSYFSRIFQQETGSTPSIYQRGGN